MEVSHEAQTHSKFVSLGKTRAMRQSDALGGATESMEHASCEYGRIKRSLDHMDFITGILITPAQSLCFKYEIKS